MSKEFGGPSEKEISIKDSESSKFTEEELDTIVKGNKKYESYKRHTEIYTEPSEIKRVTEQFQKVYDDLKNDVKKIAEQIENKNGEIKLSEEMSNLRKKISEMESRADLINDILILRMKKTGELDRMK